MADSKSFWFSDDLEAPRQFAWNAVSRDPNDRLFSELMTSDPEQFQACNHVLFGVPFDGAVLGRKGALHGPTAIRKALGSMKAGSFGRLLPQKIFDFGDLVLPRKDIERAHERVQLFSSILLKAAVVSVDKRPWKCRRAIALGGDHSLTFPLAFSYLCMHGSRFAIINLDAHLDVRETPKGQPPNSGTSFRRLIDESEIVHYTAIGVRDFHTSPKYIQFLRDYVVGDYPGARIVTANDVHNAGAARVARETLQSLPPDCESIYLSVDLDVADASVAPGVSAPTPGGLFAHQIFELIRLICADPRVHACDIMECAPNLEENSDRTARLGAACLAEMIAEQFPLPLRAGTHWPSRPEGCTERAQRDRGEG